MKLPPCEPVTISINGAPYSLADLVTHVTVKDRRYNATAEDARQGKRTRDGIASGDDLAPADLKKLAEVLERPTCGWGEFEIKHKLLKPDGSTVEVPIRKQAPTSEFLPLIDHVQNAVKSLG